MNPHRCCHNSAAQQTGPRRSTPLRRLWLTLKWAAPGAILVAMPKCPLCIAAYVALFTGVSISISTAVDLRLFVLILCFTAFAFLAIRLRVGRKRVASGL